MHKVIIIFSMFTLISCSSQNITFEESEKIILDNIKFDKNVALELKKIIQNEFVQSISLVYSYDTKTKTFSEEKKYNNGIVFELESEKIDAIINEYYKKYKDIGYYIFNSESNFGFGKDKITILKTNDQFEILKVMQTGGINYNLDNQAVINKLIEWHTNFPFEIIAADSASITARFIRKPLNMLSFAQEVYDFCPDIVDQGTNTVEVLAEEMEKSDILYLWWD